MTTDITHQLADAALTRGGWSPGDARALAGSIARAIPEGWVDWDEDSGEEWARVLMDRFVVALVRAKTPLLIVVRGEVDHVPQLGPEAVTITVDDMDTPRLAATRESIQQAFPEREVSPTLDPTGFSVMDLWFATT